MFWDLLQALSIVSYVGALATLFWFVFAVGVPLRRWLKRELGEDSPRRSSTG